MLVTAASHMKDVLIQSNVCVCGRVCPILLQSDPKEGWPVPHRPSASSPQASSIPPLILTRCSCIPAGMLLSE